MPTRTYNPTNSVIIKNVIIFNFIHNIFILYYMQNNKSNKKYNGNIVYLYRAQTFDAILFQYPIVFRFVHPRGPPLYMYPSITFRVLVTSVAVYISCHTVFHTVVRTCVFFCACFIIYNNTITKCLFQQDN
jgi:hypothetical protein